MGEVSGQSQWLLYSAGGILMICVLFVLYLIFGLYSGADVSLKGFIKGLVALIVHSPLP